LVKKKHFSRNQNLGKNRNLRIEFFDENFEKKFELSLKEHSTAQLTSFVGQSSSENSGYDASSEDDNQKAKQKATSNIPMILHPTLISFSFSVFDQFWENKSNRKPVKALLSMFKFIIFLYNREENIIKCSENDSIRLVLEKFSFVLDSGDFPECGKLILELFSSSSSFHVSPAALHIIINKLTNEKSPIEAITKCLVTLFNKTAKMISHMQIPMPIESVYNNLFDVTANQVEIVTSGDLQKLTFSNYKKLTFKKLPGVFFLRSRSMFFLIIKFFYNQIF